MVTRTVSLVGVAVCLLTLHRAQCAEPRVTDNRYQLERLAADPQIVTPIGVAFDRQGRLLVVESHTHERPKEYKGPETDRIRMYADSDGDDRLDRWSTFAEGFRHSINVLVREDGGVYLTTRHNVVLLHDTDKDGVADKQSELLRLETKDEYPHNGLGGIAISADRKKLLITMGENHGLAYQLIAADGGELSGHDGAGTIFECTLDGRELRRVALGFWNPVTIGVVPDGRVFTVDNDPDASPPCRLVHVIPGGDYGYRYEYGRAGNHPLQAWNGELPGTLPMVCGVGEAPTAIVPYAGGLWVTSWGDHRIERYELVPRGASYGATRNIIVQGGADFRPTGMTIGPDGALYFADWVLRDYPVHGRGRLWRLTLPGDELKRTFAPRSKEDLAASNDEAEWLAHIRSDDPFAHAHGATQLAKQSNARVGFNSEERVRLGMLEAERLRGSADVEPLLKKCLNDDSANVRLLAVRWVADERIMALRDDVAKLLDGPQPSSQYYLAILGAVDWLDQEPKLRGAEIADELLVRELKNEHRTANAHALALALIKPDNKFLKLERLRKYLASDSHRLRLEAVRTLVQQSNDKRVQLLAEVALDEKQPDDVRAEAIMGLGPFNDQLPDGAVVRQFQESKNRVLQREAERTLRLVGGSPSLEIKPRVADLEAWTKLLDKPGDAAAGRRLFFNPAGPRCSTCHKYGGRGGNMGPELTEIGKSTSRERIINSILQPSQEIAPEYEAWVLTTADGKTHTGLRLPKGGDDGKEIYADAAGKTLTLLSTEIEDRQVAGTSIMPDNLVSMLSIDDLRDLVTFLAGGKASAGDAASK